MKSVLAWKFISVAGFSFRFPWFVSAPLFYHSEGKIWVDNGFKKVIGVKLADRARAFCGEQPEIEFINNNPRIDKQTGNTIYVHN
jgi:hypothetical protein